MLNRPRPPLQLLAFLCGGFAMGVTVGLVVLFVVRSAVSPEQFTLPRVQVVIGVLALLIAAVLALLPARPRPDGDRLSAWALGSPTAARLGGGRSGPWHRAAIDRLPCCAGGDRRLRRGARHADRCATDLQCSRSRIIEIPLLSYLVAPDRTRAALSALYDWLRAQGRRGVATLLAVIGCVLLVVGFANL